MVKMAFGPFSEASDAYLTNKNKNLKMSKNYKLKGLTSCDFVSI